MSACADHSIIIWKLSNTKLTGELNQRLRFHNKPIRGMTNWTLPSHNVVASIDQDDYLYLFNPLDKSPPQPIQFSNYSLFSIYSSPIHSNLYLGVYNRNFRRYDILSWDLPSSSSISLSSPQFSLPGAHNGCIWSMCELENGLLLSSSSDQTIKIWNHFSKPGKQN